jgi:propanol-preferring alcohol dehydrogenase
MNLIRLVPAEGGVMRCARFYAPHEPLRLENAPERDPGADEVTVRVRAAGICGTELHFLDGLYAPTRVPMILGHEVAGEVSRVGSGVETYRHGDRVVVYYYLFCGACTWCHRGQQHLCLQPRGVFAFSADGGFAQYVTVPARCLVRLPESVAFEQAAPLCCSATTSLHAIALSGLTVGEVAVVFGAGGVGLSLVQAAKLVGARVIAVSRSRLRRVTAMEMGADAAVSPDAVADEVRRKTGAAGADVVFELSGSAETMPISIGLLGRHGRLVFIGYSADVMELSPLGLVISEQQVLGSVGNTYLELALATDLAARGLLQPPVAEVLPLEEINDGILKLRAGNVPGRLVITP